MGLKAGARSGVFLKWYPDCHLDLQARTPHVVIHWVLTDLVAWLVRWSITSLLSCILCTVCLDTAHLDGTHIRFCCSV